MRNPPDAPQLRSKDRTGAALQGNKQIPIQTSKSNALVDWHGFLHFEPSLSPRPARASRTSLRPVLAMAGSDHTSAAPAGAVAVVGAGVSGIAAAYRLRKSSVNVTVFEAADRAGGKIRSNSEGGFLWDEGANTMTESELEVSRLIVDLGLQDRQQYPNSQHKRYIVKDGALELIPTDPISLIKSSVLSTKSKFN